jgi:hypothetical protein
VYFREFFKFNHLPGHIQLNCICAMLELGLTVGVPPPPMIFEDQKVWEIATGAAFVAGVAAFGAWLFFRRQPTADEIEHDRRTFLTQSGRIVDGTLLDVNQVEGKDGRTITLLIYDYRIGGVDYECSQDISQMQGTVNADLVRAGFPCSVRYQPGNPQNSIVVAENWSGLRSNIPFIIPNTEHVTEDAGQEGLSVNHGQ